MSEPTDEELGRVNYEAFHLVDGEQMGNWQVADPITRGFFIKGAVAVAAKVFDSVEYEPTQTAIGDPCPDCGWHDGEHASDCRNWAPMPTITVVETPQAAPMRVPPEVQAAIQHSREHGHIVPQAEVDAEMRRLGISDEEVRAQQIRSLACRMFAASAAAGFVMSFNAANVAAEVALQAIGGTEAALRSALKAAPFPWAGRTHPALALTPSAAGDAVRALMEAAEGVAALLDEIAGWVAESDTDFQRQVCTTQSLDEKADAVREALRRLGGGAS